MLQSIYEYFIVHKSRELEAARPPAPSVVESPRNAVGE
jgi:hypothetical protein